MFLKVAKENMTFGPVIFDFGCAWNVWNWKLYSVQQAHPQMWIHHYMCIFQDYWPLIAQCMIFLHNLLSEVALELTY